jgi:hypothetical protein
MTSQTFRANVGIAVARADGLVLALERIDQPDRWQMPQGGINIGEEPPEASLRELREETGLHPEHVELVAEHPSWLAYELPPARRRRLGTRGQVQRWFLYRFLGRELGGFRSTGYKAHMETDLFKEGIKKLKALAKESPTAFLCSERDPAGCHRRHIAEVLKQQGFTVEHLGRPGQILLPGERPDDQGTLFPL